MKKISLTIILILLLSCFCYSQDYWKGSEYISDGVRQPLIIHSSKEEAKILKDRWQAIGEELKTTDSLLAGTYVKAGYRGWYLRWSPKNGFVYIFHYENINIIDYSYGKVEVSGSEVTFIPEREMQEEFRDRKLTTPKLWIVIGRNLIPKNQIKDFADYQSGLGEYNNWDCECMAFFSKSKSLPSKAPRFIIPNQYKHLFRPPIEDKIVFAGKQIIHKATEEFGAYIETPVRVNVGAIQGVKKEMILRTPNYGRTVVITKVKPTYSEGTITDTIWDEFLFQKGMIATYYDYETGKYKPLPPIQVGTKVTTKLF